MDIESSLTVTCMEEEMFNDALYYLEQAQLTDKQFIKWRYCRSSIISFCTSAEAMMSRLIVYKLKKLENLNSKQSEILDYLTNPDIDKAPPWEIGSIQRKYDFLRKLNGLDEADINSDYDALTKLRNKIVHYSNKSQAAVYSENLLEYTLNSREIIKDFICTISDICQVNHPSWVNNEVSRVIE